MVREIDFTARVLSANSGQTPSDVTSPQTRRRRVMTIFELGAFEEFVGSVAVIATLIYRSVCLN